MARPKHCSKFAIKTLKASEKKRNICNFNKFCVFFYSYIFEVTHLKWAFLMCVYIYIYICICNQPDYRHYNGFVATHALGHMMYGYTLFYQ